MRVVTSRRTTSSSRDDDPTSVAVVRAIEQRLRAIERGERLPALERPDDQAALYAELLSAALRDAVLADAARARPMGADDTQRLGLVYEALMGGRVLPAPGTDDGARPSLGIASSDRRRSTSAFYTPAAMGRALVRATLDPLLRAFGPDPSSEAILGLRVCDASMGSGALLLEACTLLAERVVEAWAREGTLSDHEDAALDARRLVATRCLFGLDRNEHAVQLARASLWLWTRAGGDPFEYLSESLLHGDALVGLDDAQLRARHWCPERTQNDSIDRAPGPRASGSSASRSWRADGAMVERSGRSPSSTLEGARLLGDVIVGAFFEHDRAGERERELRRRLDVLAEHDPVISTVRSTQRTRAVRTRGSDVATARLRCWQHEARARVPIFHWPLAFVSAFGDAPVAFDAFVGNPPFVDGKRVSTVLGDRYSDWITTIHRSKKTADLSGHFVRRCFSLLAASATLGTVATNSLSEGETRAVGLQHALARGAVIYDATRSTPWPGAAAVHVALVCLARGHVIGQLGARRLDGRAVEHIRSSLTAGIERGDPKKLAANAGLSFHGYKPYGEGFQLSPSERDELVRRDPRNAQRIRPYAGGVELNGQPTLTTSRWVIHFGDATLDEARAWPDLLSILEERVRPARATADDSDDGRRLKERWWQFFRERPDMQRALRGKPSCLALARVAKHLVVQKAPASWVLDEDVIVFALHGWSAFAVLQSRVHERWARAHSSTFGRGLRYSSSRAFDTFPFPRTDPAASIDELESAGAELHEMRAAYQRDANVGSTTTYNRLRDPRHAEPRVVELRALHEALDRAVLAAYGVTSIDVPPYDLVDPDGARERGFTDDVLDHLHSLNAQRAQQEPAVSSMGRVRAPRVRS